MNYKVAKKTVEFHQLPLNYLLENVYLPPFQRPENDEHIETIFTGLREYYDEHREVFLPGTISVGRLPDKPKMILFDGQHRIRALERLCKIHRAVCNHLIRIDIYNVQTEEDAQKLYHIINSNKKVDLFDGNIEPFVIPVVQKFFKENFSDYCKASNAPRGINISLETLGKKLRGNDKSKQGSWIHPDLSIQNFRMISYHFSKFLNDFLCDAGIPVSLLVETMVLSKLRAYREQANRDRFILPDDKEESFFTRTIDECIEFI